MPSVEVVTHCWAEALPHYAAALNYQLSSFVLNPPVEADVQVTVCFTPTDVRTVEVLNWFRSNTTLRIMGLSCDRGSLGRRSIGRDRAARYSKADFVWFTDVDHVFQGALDRLVDVKWPDGVAMIFPKEIMIHQDHVTGDKASRMVEGRPGLIKVDTQEFVLKKYRKAIGGVQIVKGDFARLHGYLSIFSKWMQPAVSPFGDFKDDVAYRNFCRRHGRIVGVDLPWVYRIRHSQTTYMGARN